MSSWDSNHNTVNPENEARVDLFERVFNSVHSMIAYLDLEFNFIRVNRAYAEAHKKPTGFFIGKNHFKLFPHAENQTLFNRVVQTGIPHFAFEASFDLPLQTASTSTYWDWSLEPVRDGSNTAGLVLTLVDVTDRKNAKDALRLSEQKKEEILSDRDLVEQDRMRLAAVIEQADEGTLEKQLRQAQKMEALGTLAGGIAHDLNNILMPIIMNTEMIEEDLEPDSPMRHFADKVLASAHRGRDLVQRILNFSRKKDEEKKRFSVGKQVKEAIALVRPTMPSAVEIKQLLSEGAGQIQGDPAQIQEIIINLCTNAAHAIGMEAGVIELSVENADITPGDRIPHPDLETGSYVKLSVRDTGVGMDDPLIERIFEPFFTTKKPGEGTGMGLAMVHGTVQRHGGQVNVTSTPGKGTVFDIFFPRAKSLPEVTQQHHETPRGKGEHIFLVDDEDDIIQAAKGALVRLGYKVSSANRAGKALERFRVHQGQYDIAILDFALREMTGLELAKQIREVCPDIPIIIATGFGGAVDRAEMKALGIQKLVNKPLTSYELGKAVQGVLYDKKLHSKPVV